MRLDLLPAEAIMPIGVAPEHFAGDWLCDQMDARNISPGELSRRLNRLGYDGSCVNISQWRGNKTAIPTETVPSILEALGMSRDEQKAWGRHFAFARFPSLTQLIVD